MTFVPNQQTTGRTVVGLFTERSDADAAIRDLHESGFAADQLGVAMRYPGEHKSFAEEASAPVAQGAAAGAVSGGVVGGLVGLLASLLVPGLGPVIAGGVLASLLTGAGVGAATGGVLGALVGLGIPEAEARHFDSRFREGGVLVTVDAGARSPEAAGILRRHGADLGPSPHVSAAASGATAYAGIERRVRHDPDYAGPERRAIGVF